jgi:hypothetical protein
MALMARDKGGGDYEPIPEDLHLAICYGIWDLGMQYNDHWHQTVHKVVIVWELPEVRGEFERDGKKVNLPRAISKQYRLSLHKKAGLRKDLESWRGKKFTDEELSKGFDLKKLLGVPCQIQVLHNKVEDKTYANVSAIIKAPGGIKLLPENPITFFSFEDGVEIPPSTPEWITKLIKEAKEYGGGIPDEHELSEGEELQDQTPF